jgi:hypothetical protein
MSTIDDPTLERHAFGAQVIKIGSDGPKVSDWLGFAAGRLGGYVGDILVGGSRLRIAAARGSIAAHDGCAVPDAVNRVFERRLDEIARGDPLSACVVGDVAAWLEAFHGAGGAYECSMAGLGLHFDFCRSRHGVDLAAGFGALHVHGRTVVGLAADPSSPVRSVDAQAGVTMTGGGLVPLSAMESGTATWALPSLAVSEGGGGMRETDLGAIRDRILKLSAGDIDGPVPRGMLLSKSAPGDVLALVDIDFGRDVSIKAGGGRLSLKGEGATLLQTRYAGSTVVEWLRGADVRVVRIVPAVA